MSRGILPDSYRLEHWNNGLMRGTVRVGEDVYAYGAAGVYRTTPEMKDYSPAMDGLPKEADVRDLAAAADGRLFCTTAESAYTLAPGEKVWAAIKMPKKMKPSSLCLKDGDVYLVGRSGLARVQAPYATAEKLDTPPPADAPQGGSMLGLVKDLHHGKLFGTVGIVVVDIIALVFVVLCISGFLYWLLRMLFPRLGASLRPLGGRSLKLNLSTHRFLGRWTLWGLVLVTVTGWFLMKPLRSAISFTLPAGEAPSWLGKAPAVRYDAATHDFLVAGGAGLYSLTAPLRHLCEWRMLPRFPARVCLLCCNWRTEAGSSAPLKDCSSGTAPTIPLRRWHTAPWAVTRWNAAACLSSAVVGLRPCPCRPPWRNSPCRSNCSPRTCTRVKSCLARSPAPTCS